MPIYIGDDAAIAARILLTEGQVGHVPLPYPFIYTPEVRYFRRNEGTTDYAQFAAPVVLPSDFEIEFLSQTPNAGGYFLANLSGTANSDRLLITSSGGFFGFSDATSKYGASLTSSSALNHIKLRRVGSACDLFINGVFHGTQTSTVTVTFNSIYHPYGGSTSTPILNGVIANLKIWDNGVLVMNCPIDESSGATIFDIVGGNNATIINGLDADRGKFIDQPTLWKGENLTVPPWDSVDQELLKS